jgi:hypothetical protein
MGEIINEGLSYEVTPSGIVIYQVANLHNTTLESLLKVFRAQELDALESKRHLRQLINVQHSGYPTPYFTAKIVELFNGTTRNLSRAYALVAPHILTAQLARLIHPNASLKIFTDHHEALAWLENQAPAHT